MAKEKAHLQKVKEQFDAMDDYDRATARILPDYELMLDSLALVAQRLVRPKSMLELGVGTGIVAERMLRSFPKARLVAVDFAPNMIARAGKRLSRFSKRVQLIEGDFYETPFPRSTDLVFSSLAIHHLSDIQKAQLYEKVYWSLADDGVFINADCVAATSDRLAQAQGQCWVARMEERGATQEQIDKTIADHYEYDIPATVDDQLGWLERAGFAEVECIWRVFGFAMIVAIK